MPIQQTGENNYSSTALELLLTGEHSPRADSVTRALAGTRLLALIEGVPIAVKNAAAIDRQSARDMLTTDAARKLFDELIAEGVARVRWRPKGRLVVTMIASAIALHADRQA